MKNKLLHALLQPAFLLTLILMLSLSGVKAQTGYYGADFTFSDTATTTGYAYMDNAATNGNPSVQLQATPIWGIISNDYDNFAIGVWYDITYNEAAVYDETTGPSCEGSAFNVLAPTNAHGTSFLQVSTLLNISSAVTFIDNPATNNNPNAIIFATHNWNPDIATTYEHEVPDPIGVYYDGTVGEWSVFYEDNAAFLDSTAYNIFVPDTSRNVFTVTATKSNGGGYYILSIDNPLINGDPNAVLIVTQVWNPGGVGGIYNNHPIGVWYDSPNWTIFNEDEDTMATGASFNVLVASAASAGIKPVAAAGQPVMVYPSPASTNINLRLPKALAANSQVDIYNLLGQNMYELPQNSNATLSIDVSQWPEGTYIVRTITGATTYSSNFVVARR